MRTIFRWSKLCAIILNKIVPYYSTCIEYNLAHHFIVTPETTTVNAVMFEVESLRSLMSETESLLVYAIIYNLHHMILSCHTTRQVRDIRRCLNVLHAYIVFLEHMKRKI